MADFPGKVLPGDSSETKGKNLRQKPFTWNVRKVAGKICWNSYDAGRNLGWLRSALVTHIRIVEVLKPDTSPGQTERTIRMNATGRRFQRSVDTVTLEGLVDPYRMIEVKVSPNARSKKMKASIAELVLRHCTSEDKPIFLSVTKKFNSASFEACYIKLYEKQGRDFADCPAGYLVHTFPEAKDEILKAFSPSAVEIAQDAIWDEDKNRLVTLQEKEANEDIDQVARQIWLLDDLSPTVEQRPFQLIGLPGEPDKQSDGQANQEKETSIRFNFDSGLSVDTTRTTPRPRGQSSGLPAPILLNPQGYVGKDKDRHQSFGDDMSAVTMDSRVSSLEASLKSHGELLLGIQNLLKQLAGGGTTYPPSQAVVSPGPPSGGSGA